MSREVDERVVEMQFDNKQFESGVAQTIKSLDRLSESLKFEGVSKSVTAIQNGINRLNLDPLTNAASSVADAYTTLAGKIKMEVFDRIAKMATDTGQKVINELFLGGAKAGMAEYETQQGAIQTILANTQHLGTTVKDVTAALDELNDYADLTIYNFTEMTRNIGTFTAAGLDLETSTSAIKGIANLAAVSGSTSTQASTAMYQLSQALSAGVVKLQDWNSVVNAGMGGKVFQDALRRTAKNMGIAVNETLNFRETLSDGWLTSEVLSETLKQISGDVTEIQLAAQGYSQEEIETIMKLAETAVEAATVVKTSRQLIDTVTEQIGSGWTRTWQIIFGDFEESKALWTSIYKAISPYIDAISDLRNEQLQFWKENEGREKVLEAFSNLWSGASTFIDNFTAAFRRAFPIFDNFGQTLLDISDRFLAFSERFKVVKDKADQVTTSFENVSNAISKITQEDKKNALDIWNWGNINGNPGRIDGQDRVEALGESYDRVQKYINTFIATGYDIAKTDEILGVGAEEVAVNVDKMTKAMSESMTVEQKNDAIMLNVIRTLRNLANIASVIGRSVSRSVKAAGEAFKDVFDPLTTSVDLIRVSAGLSKVAGAFEITAKKAEDVKRIFRGVFAAFDIVYQLIKAVVQVVGRSLIPSLGAVDKAGGSFLKVLGDIGDWIYALDQAIKEGDLFTYLIDSMISAMSLLGMKVADAVRAFEDWSGINFGKIFNTMKNGIKTFIGYLKEGDFKGAFAYAIGGIINIGKAIIDFLKNLDWKTIFSEIGSTLSQVGGYLGAMFEDVFGGAARRVAKSVSEASGSFSLLDTLGMLIYGAYWTITQAVGKIRDFFNSPTAVNIGSAFKRFFSNLFGGDGADEGESSKFGKVLGNIGAALRQLYEDIKPLIGAGFIAGLIKIVSDFSSATKNISEAPLALNEAVKSLGESFNDMTKAFKVDAMTRFMTELANSVLKLVVALVVLTFLDPAKVAIAVGVITGMLGEIIGALTFSQKKLDSELNMAAMTLMIKQLGNTMLVLAASLWIIAKNDPTQIVFAVIAFTAMLSEMMGAMYIMFDMVRSKQFRKGAENVLMLISLMKQIGESMVVMSIALLILSKIPSDRIGTALLGMVGIFGVLALLTLMIAEESKTLKGDSYVAIQAMATAMVGIAAAFLVMAPAIAIMSLIPEDNMNRALNAVLVIGVIFAGLMTVSELMSKGAGAGAILAAGAAMILVATAINTILPALLAISLMDPDKVLFGLEAMGLMLAGIALILAALAAMGGGNVALAGVGILAVAAAIAIMTPAIIAFGAAALPVVSKIMDKFSKMSDDELSKFVKSVLKMSGVLAVAGIALTVFGAGLAVVGVALAVIGVATLLMTPFVTALSGLIVAMTAMSAVWPMVKTMLEEFGPALGNAFVGFITTIIGGFGKIADAIKEAAPKISEAIGVILVAIVNAIWGWLPEFAELVLQMADVMLAAIDAYLPGILEFLGSIISTILGWLSDNAEDWTASLVEIWCGIILGIFTGLSKKADDIVATIIDFIIAVLDALANNMKTKGDDLLDSFENFWTEFFTLLGKAVMRVIHKIEVIGGDVIDYIITGLEDKGGDAIDTIITFFTEDLPAEFKEIWDDIKQIGKDIVNKIKDGIVEAKNTVVDAVTGLVKDALDVLGLGWMISSPSRATEQMGEYFSLGAAEGIDAASGEVANATEEMADDALSAFAEALADDADSLDTTLEPNITIDPNATVDTSGITNSLDNIDIDNIFSSANLGGSFTEAMDFSALLGEATARSDAQRHADTEANNAILGDLNNNISDLVDRLENGMINIPDNATFNMPVYIDGEEVANATAPYLDVINGGKLDLANGGATSR